MKHVHNLSSMEILRDILLYLRRKWYRFPPPLYFIPDELEEIPSSATDADLLHRSEALIAGPDVTPASTGLRKQSLNTELVMKDCYRQKLLEMENAATTIQCFVRTCQATRVLNIRWQAALYHAAIERLSMEDWIAKERIKKLQDMIQSTALRNHQEASCEIIQSNWRGYSLRSRLRRNDLNVPVPDEVEVTENKPTRTAHGPPIRRKFNPEIHRRVWARTAFKSANGWPGTSEVECNIMEYIDHPPILESNGLRSMKVPLAPKNIGQDYILCSKRKSWVGIPVSVVPINSDVIERSFSCPKKPDEKYRIKSKCNKTNETEVSLIGNLVERDTEQRRQLRAIGWSDKNIYSLLPEEREIISDRNMNSSQEEFNSKSVFLTDDKREIGNTTDQKPLEISANMSKNERIALSGVLYEKHVLLPWGKYMSKLFQPHNKKEKRNSKLRTAGSKNVTVVSVVGDDMSRMSDRKVKKSSQISSKKYYRTVYTWVPQSMVHKVVNMDRLQRSNNQENDHTENNLFTMSNKKRLLTSQEMALLSHENEINYLSSNYSESYDNLDALNDIENLPNPANTKELQKRNSIQNTENLKYTSGSTTLSFSEKNIKDLCEYQFTHHSAWPCKKRSRISPSNSVNSTTLERYINAEKKQGFGEVFKPPTVTVFQHGNRLQDEIDFSIAKTSSEIPVSNSNALLHHYHWL